MSDEIIPLEVDTRIAKLQAEITRLLDENTSLSNELVIQLRAREDEQNIISDLREENGLLKDTIDIITDDRSRVRNFNQRLMKELSQHGWGDFHYGSQEQDRNIVALLEEGGFQYERGQEI